MNHPILTAYLNKTKKAAEALTEIGTELMRKDLSKKQIKELTDASEAIMDIEVPLLERDLDAEETYLAKLSKDEE